MNICWKPVFVPCIHALRLGVACHSQEPVIKLEETISNTLTAAHTANERGRVKMPEYSVLMEFISHWHFERNW